MSQGEVELSVISKNFFFSFFNYFVVFTTLGTIANVWQIFDRFQDTIKDTTWLANQLARSLSGLTSFYTNLIILQGIGLFPFRLLEFGSVFLYPFYRWASKTPRGTYPYHSSTCKDINENFQIMLSYGNHHLSITASICLKFC